MSMSDFQTLEPKLAELQDYYESTRGEMARSELPAEAIGGINLQFTLVATYIAKLGLKGSLGAGVVVGTVTRERWVSVANEQGRALQGILVQLDQENLWNRAWKEIVVQSVDDVRQGVADAAEAAPGILGTLTVLFGLFVVWQVARAFK